MNKALKTTVNLVVLLLSVLPLALVQAQDGGGATGTLITDVYVTTQDFSSLRAGPGITFERIMVLDPAVTLPALGRSVDTRWIQVDYEGQRGWIARRLLVWSGDLSTLRIDGVDPAPFIRRAGVVGYTTRETPIYRSEVTPDDQVGVLPAGTPVELTGRLGSRGFFRFQILHEGQVFWVGAWNIRLTTRGYMNLLDTSYLYPYGRLVIWLGQDLSDSESRLSQIERIWRRLDAGESVSCGFIPRYLSRRTSDADVRQESIFAPPIHALDIAIEHVNAAISAFADACGRAGEGFFLTQQDVDAALDEADNARRNLNLARSLLNALRIRDPLLYPENQ